MATDLGKVGIVMKGTWSSGTTYEALDAVTYNSGTYIAKQSVPAGTLPTNTTYWQVGLSTAGLPNIASQNIAGTAGTASIDVIAGSIIFIGRNSAGVKGLYYVDPQGIPIGLVEAASSVTVTNDGNNHIVVTNNTGVAIRVTFIIPF